MSFSRDELAAYEKSAAPAAETAPVSAPPAATPPADPAPEAPAPEGESSPPAASDSDVPSDAPTAEPADAAPATAETDDSTAEPAAAPPRSRQTIPMDRFQEVVDERNSLRKYGEHLLATISELKKGGTQPTTATEATPAEPAPSAATDDPPPTLEQFQYDPVKFSKATSEWLAKTVDKRVQTAVQNVQAQQTEQAIRATFESRAEAFAKTHPDFAVVIKNPDLPALHGDVAAKVLRSEHGAAITYHLAKNPDVATRVAKMSRDDQMAAFGRLEAQVSAPTAAPAAPAKPASPKQKSVTQAPPPPTPTPGGSVVAPKRTEEMSMDEWVAHDRAQKIAERQRIAQLRGAMRKR